MLFCRFKQDRFRLLILLDLIPQDALWLLLYLAIKFYLTISSIRQNSCCRCLFSVGIRTASKRDGIPKLTHTRNGAIISGSSRMSCDRRWPDVHVTVANSSWSPTFQLMSPAFSESHPRFILRKKSTNADTGILWSKHDIKLKQLCARTWSTASGPSLKFCGLIAQAALA